MGQILQPDVINRPESTSPVVTFPGRNIITIGGQQFILDDPAANINNNGLNGLDVGSPVNLTMYNIFAATQGGVAGLVLSVSSAPSGFINYRKIGELFYANSVIIYQYKEDDQQNRAIVADVGSRSPDPGRISDAYWQLSCGVSLGTGYWEVQSTVESGNSGGSHEQLFFQSVFSDVDGTDTIGIPTGTNVEAALIVGSRVLVFGQFAPSVSGADFNSMGIEHTIKLNVTSPMTIFQTPRMQMNNPQFSTCSGKIIATRLGPAF
jgi:hypothetical protein